MTAVGVMTGGETIGGEAVGGGTTVSETTGGGTIGGETVGGAVIVTVTGIVTIDVREATAEATVEETVEETEEAKGGVRGVAKGGVAGAKVGVRGGSSPEAEREGGALARETGAAADRWIDGTAEGEAAAVAVVGCRRRDTRRLLNRTNDIYSNCCVVL